MVRHADRVCAQGLKDSDALRGAAQPGARGKTAAAEVDGALEVLNRQIDAFASLRGPPSTDAARETAVRQLRRAAAGLDGLRAVIERQNLTVDEAVRASPELVDRVNTASARANNALVELGFLGCVGVQQGG